MTGPTAHTRRRRSDGERSREAILREAAKLATVEGLDGLSLARLAEAVGMSKSGLFAHFGSKEELQLATVDAAGVVFDDDVIRPASAAPEGVARLRAFAQRFLGHVGEGVFPGGCFFASAAMELDTRPGPVRDRAMAVLDRWSGMFVTEAEKAKAAGELDPAVDPVQLGFELNAFLLMGNARFVTTGDPAVLERAMRAVDDRLAAAAA